MRHGHQFGIGFYGPFILIFLLIIFIILLVILSIMKKKSLNPFSVEAIKILKTKYASGDITVDEFLDVKDKIEKNKIDNDIILKFIKGEVSYEEFKNLKKLWCKVRTLLNILNIILEKNKNWYY